MSYVLTIYFIFAFDIVSIQELTPNLTACRAEAVKIISELDFPPSITIHTECVMEIEV